MSDAIENIERKLGGDVDSVALSAIAEFQIMMLELSGKGLEPCTLAKDPGKPGANWV